MIASKSHRSQGLGIAAVRALILFLRRNEGAILAEYAAGGADRSVATDTAPPPPLTPLDELVVKIKESNAQSIALFRRGGFVQRGGVNYFGEVELVWTDWRDVHPEAEGHDASGTWYQEVRYLRKSPEV